MPRASTECEFTCPNCGSTMVAAIPGEVKCSGEGCPYRFRVFGKHDREKAANFYLTRPSKRLKYLKQAKDKRYFVAFCEKVEPFIAENLLALINPKALQTIQMGLSERLKKPMTIMVRFRDFPEKKPGSDFPVQITERNSQVFGRVDPVNPRAHFCERCRRIRDFPNGEQACLNYDMDMTSIMIETEDPTGVWQPCWAGLVDFAIPVVINGFVAAVFMTGQIRWTDPEGEAALLVAGCGGSGMKEQVRVACFNFAQPSCSSSLRHVYPPRIIRP